MGACWTRGDIIDKHNHKANDQVTKSGPLRVDKQKDPEEENSTDQAQIIFKGPNRQNKIQDSSTNASLQQSFNNELFEEKIEDEGLNHSEKQKIQQLFEGLNQRILDQLNTISLDINLIDTQIEISNLKHDIKEFQETKRRYQRNIDYQQEKTRYLKRLCRELHQKVQTMQEIQQQMEAKMKEQEEKYEQRLQNEEKLRKEIEENAKKQNELMKQEMVSQMAAIAQQNEEFKKRNEELELNLQAKLQAQSQFNNYGSQEKSKDDQQMKQLIIKEEFQTPTPIEWYWLRQHKMEKYKSVTIYSYGEFIIIDYLENKLGLFKTDDISKLFQTKMLIEDTSYYYSSHYITSESKLYICYDNGNVFVLDPKTFQCKAQMQLENAALNYLELDKVFLLAVGQQGNVFVINFKNDTVVASHQFEDLNDIIDIQKTSRADRKEFMISSKDGIHFFVLKQKGKIFDFTLTEECYLQGKVVKSAFEYAPSKIIACVTSNQGLILIDRSNGGAMTDLISAQFDKQFLGMKPFPNFNMNDCPYVAVKDKSSIFAVDMKELKATKIFECPTPVEGIRNFFLSFRQSTDPQNDIELHTIEYDKKDQSSKLNQYNFSLKDFKKFIS